MAAITVDDGLCRQLHHILPVVREEGVHRGTTYSSTRIISTAAGYHGPRGSRPSCISRPSRLARCLAAPPIQRGYRSELAPRGSRAVALRQALSRLDQADREQAIDAIARTLARVTCIRRHRSHGIRCAK